MPLPECPHMTARCPHYRAECNDPASDDCHYIKRTTANMVAALYAVGVEKLSPKIKEYLEQMEAFLTKMERPLLKK